MATRVHLMRAWFIRTCMSRVSSGADEIAHVALAEGALRPSEEVRSLVPKFRSRSDMNYFDVLRHFGGDSYGVGSLRVARGMWIRNGYQDSFWVTTRVIPGLRPGGRRVKDKVYGVLTWKGKQDPVERRIKTVCKRDWRLAPTSTENHPPAQTTL
mmetsp:Transcript_4136/g.7956  ORF Transcript_4136/g.7956 Transcript_4136/m.7956 type:complete len:155 (+) Transcript_4136:132-596(+)